MPVETVLRQCLSGQALDFSIQNSTIVITRSSTVVLQPAENLLANAPPPIDVHHPQKCSPVDSSSAFEPTYQWKQGSSIISGATGQDLMVYAAGSYKVTVTGANGCSSISASQTVISDPVTTVTASGPLTFCAGGSVTLAAASGIAATLPLR